MSRWKLDDGTEVFGLVRHAKPKIRTILITGCRPEIDATVVRVVAKEPIGPVTSRSMYHSSWKPWSS